MRRSLAASVLALAVMTAVRAEAAGGQWSARASLASARQEIGAARIGGEVYVVGGLTGPPLAGLASVEVYDIALDQWSNAAALPAARDHMGVAALDGRLYVVGGFAGDFVARSETWIYDPGADAWTAGPPLPAPRGGLWMVAYGSRLYAFGGVGVNGQATRSTFIFDPASGQWTSGLDMPTAREHLNAVVVAAFIYVIGGRSAGSTAVNERYDPATNTWKALTPMPTARSATAAAAIGGRIWVAGGEVPQLFAVNEVYDVASDRWCRDTPMAIPRHGIAAVALEDRILAPAGGIVQGLQPTAAVDVFVPGDEPRFAALPACPPAPAVCRAAAAGKSWVSITDRPGADRRDRLAWLWTRGAATDAGDFGSPLAGDGLALCVYDGSGLRMTTALPGDVPACGLATAASRWRAVRRGFSYRDRTLAPDGIQRALVQGGADGKARIAINGKGTKLPLPSLSTLTSPLTLQLRSDTGACWGASFAFPPARRNDAARFVDRSD